MCESFCKSVQAQLAVQTQLGLDSVDEMLTVVMTKDFTATSLQNRFNQIQSWLNSSKEHQVRGRKA